MQTDKTKMRLGGAAEFEPSPNRPDEVHQITTDGKQAATAGKYVVKKTNKNLKAYM